MLSSFNILVAKSKIHDGLDMMLTLPLSRGQYFLPPMNLPLDEHSSTYAVPFPYCFEVAKEFLSSVHHSPVVCFNTQPLQSLRHGTSKCQQLLALHIHLCFLISLEQPAYLRGESRWLNTTTQRYMPACVCDVCYQNQASQLSFLSSWFANFFGSLIVLV